MTVMQTMTIMQTASILSEIRRLICLRLDARLTSLIRSNIRLLSKKDVGSILRYMCIKKKLPYGSIEYLLFLSPYRHDYGPYITRYSRIAIKAVEVGNLDVLKLLIENGKVDANYNEGQFFRLACYHNRPSIVTYLLSKNYDRIYAILYNYAITKAVDRGRVEIIDILLSDRCAPQTLPDRMLSESFCAGIGRTDIAQRLLARGIDPSYSSNIAITMACKGKSEDLVSLLLADERTNPAANNNTALYTACCCLSPRIVSILLADSRVRDAGLTYCISDMTNILTGIALKDPKNSKDLDDLQNAIQIRAMLDEAYYGRTSVSDVKEKS